jgi:protein-S-isoprenylcysteine O-methyltransferase Ste14
MKDEKSEVEKPRRLRGTVVPRTVPEPGKEKSVSRLRFRVVLGVVYPPAIFALVLFVPAGTVDWPRAWVFLGVVLVASLGTMAVLAEHDELLDERFKPPIQKGQPLADKIVVVLFVAAFLGAIFLIPVDVFRLRLLGEPPLAVSVLGLVFVVAGWSTIAAAMRENAFAAPVVKHQAARRQTVVDTGLYARVRHPMYAGGVLLMTGMPLWLGSWAAALAALVPIALLAVRIRFEEAFLRHALAGYGAYTDKVRYRLIPFVW